MSGRNKYANSYSPLPLRNRLGWDLPSRRTRASARSVGQGQNQGIRITHHAPEILVRGFVATFLLK
jgi:hypothetical protein